MKPKNLIWLLGLLLWLAGSDTGWCFYNPSTGRWLSRDPIGEQGRAGIYTYVDNHATTAVDHLGLWTYWLHLWKTYDWAVARGFQHKYASITGAADKELDSLAGGNNSFPVVGQADRHMPGKPRGAPPVDTRVWWYEREFAAAVQHLARSDTSLNENDCIQAAQAFGRGLHSFQDKSAHRAWPERVIGRGVIPHPGWWDAYENWELPGNLGMEWWWHLFVHRDPDYDWWQNSPSQIVSLGGSRYAVAQDSAAAINRFKAEVQRHCFCKPRMLSAGSSTIPSE